MIDSEFRSYVETDNFKEIEDVIDARKKLGQYNVHKYPNPLSNRCFFNPLDVNRKFDEGSIISSDKDIVLRYTESEITIVRVTAVFRTKLSKWDTMNDIAVPGDGTHLGESPSMVNLATLVPQCLQSEGEDEYLVPLSSWDPCFKSDEAQAGLKSSSDSKISEKFCVRCSKTDPTIGAYLENSGSTQIEPDDEEERRRPSWAGKFSKFWRRHWRRSGLFGEPEPPEEKLGDDHNKPGN